MEKAATIPVLYSTVHVHHAPPVEYAHAGLQRYAEVPARAETILYALMDTGFMAPVPLTDAISSEMAAGVHDALMLDTLAEIASAASAYIYPAVFAVRDHMRGLQRNPAARLGYYSFDVCAPLGPDTILAAAVSANVAYQSAVRLYEQSLNTVYALCRPPGHHAGRDYIGGYCYLNNAAIAASYLRQFGKVAILDVDYHHGNGTQDIFWNDPEILFVSIHADPDVEYPHCSGYADERGVVVGSNLNLPLPLGTTWNTYQVALQQALAAIALFSPRFLVLSLGFDTYRHDPISDFALDVPDFQEMGKLIASLGLPTVYVQEGGYAVEALGALATAFFTGVQTCLR